MSTYYFDTNATTPLAPEVLEAMQPFLATHFGNPSSLHQEGRIPARAIRNARRQTAGLLGARSENEIVFTSGGTESNNIALRSALANPDKKRRIVTSAVEHSSIRKLCGELRKEGYEIQEIGVDSQGGLNLRELEAALTPETALVSLMWANNETGVIFPIQKMGTVIKEKGILFHVDAVQAVGKIPLCLQDTPIDFLSLSAHKFYGPKGVGALYVRETTPYRSLIFGGSQEKGRRGGTENVAGIVGLGAACTLVRSELPSSAQKMKTLRDFFEAQVSEKIEGVTVNGKASERIANTSNLSFEGVDTEALLIALDLRGIRVSSGSACMSGSHEPSHVLKAMGRSDDEANSAIRFSFGRGNTQREIESAIPVLSETVSRLRALDLLEQHSH